VVSIGFGGRYERGSLGVGRGCRCMNALPANLCCSLCLGTHWSIVAQDRRECKWVEGGNGEMENGEQLQFQAEAAAKAKVKVLWLGCVAPGMGLGEIMKFCLFSGKAREAGFSRFGQQGLNCFQELGEIQGFFK
jgi:hypothetical protein